MSARGAVGHRTRSERGSAAVLATVLTGVLVTATALAAVLAGAVVDQRRAESAADLAALAGAAALQRGADGCAAADAAVRRNGASLVRCAPDGAEIRVSAARPPRSALGVRWQAGSTARAGPVGLVGQRAGGGDW